MTFGTGAIIGLNLDLGPLTVACAADGSPSSVSGGAARKFRVQNNSSSANVRRPVCVAADSRKNIRFVMGKSFGVSPINRYGNGSAVAVRLRRQRRSTSRFSAISPFPTPGALPDERTILEFRRLLPAHRLADPCLKAPTAPFRPERFFALRAESFATELLARIHASFVQEFPIAEMFISPELAVLAAGIDRVAAA